LGTTANYYLQNPGKMIESGFEQFVRQASQELGPEQLRQMVLQKLGKDALLAAVPLPMGKGGAVAKIGQALKSGLSVSSYLDTAGDIAKRITNPATLELLDDLKFLANDAKDQLGEALKVWSEKPDAAMAEAMSIAAYMDPCIRARKCQLVPYNATEKGGKDEEQDGEMVRINGRVAQGNGCCPGQTAHHLIPHNAVKDAKCTHERKNAAGIPKSKPYTYGGAPTICLEGQDNNFGTHGKAHAKLGKAMEHWRDSIGNAISYPDMRDKALDAVSHVTKHCKPECLKAQLDSYYKNCKDLKAVAGTNSDPKIDTTKTDEGNAG
jgi:GHH signature containing HNH/Endo VII superfamily nuclease toxin  2